MSRNGIPHVPSACDGEKMTGNSFFISCCDCGLRHLFYAVPSGDFVTMQIFRDDWGTAVNRSVDDYPMRPAANRKPRGRRQ